MRIYKKFFHYCLILIVLSLPTSFAHAKMVPSSFADLAEKLMPSVVNIASTQTIRTTSNPFPFEFPVGSPFEELFNEFNQLAYTKATGLGSAFDVCMVFSVVSQLL